MGTSMKEKEINIRSLFPNAVTMTALAFGVSSVNMAFWGHWTAAVIFIALSGIFDFLDGKVARLLNVSSRFGAELDSLSDFVSFGVAPAFLMYLWTMDAEIRISALQHQVGRSEAIGIYWVFVLFVSMCCAARLARFNSLLGAEQPAHWKHFFMGVPAPAGAYLTIMPLILWLATDIEFFRHPLFAGAFLILSGVMMASKVPTFCLKHVHVSAEYSSLVMIVALFVLAGLISVTWLTLSILGICYLISIPVGIVCFFRLKKKTRGGGRNV